MELQRTVSAHDGTSVVSIRESGSAARASTASVVRTVRPLDGVDDDPAHRDTRGACGAHLWCGAGQDDCAAWPNPRCTTSTSTASTSPTRARRRTPGPVPPRVPGQRPHWRHLLPRLAGAGLPRGRTVLRGTRRQRCRPTAATRPGRWPATRSGSTRRSAAMTGRSHRPRLGPPAAYGAAVTRRSGGGASSAWPCRPATRWARRSSTNRAAQAVAGTCSSSSTRSPTSSSPADDLAFVDRLWADWSPGFDGADDVAPREGVAARAGQPRRRPRLLPRRPGRGGPIPSSPTSKPTMADPAPADPVPPRRRRRLHRRRGRRDGAAEARDHVEVEIVSRHRPLPPPRAAGRRQRPIVEFLA